MTFEYKQAFESIPCGKYKHYKGGEYEVIGIALNSETLDPMVVYRETSGEHRLWARPAKMWNEEVDGVPRFSRIKERIYFPPNI